MSGRTVTLTLAAAAGHGQTVTLSYTVPTGTDAKPVRDGAENEAAAFSDRTVTNNTPDTAAPALATATVNGSALVLTYNEALDEGSEPAAGAYAVKLAGGAGVAPSAAAVSGRTVTLTLATAAGHGQTVTLSYTVPTGTDAKPVRDGAENEAAAFSNRAVTNNTPDTAAPALATATVNGSALVLTYNEALDESSEPAAGAYAVKLAGGAGVAPSAAAVSGRTVTLTLAAAAGHGQTVTLSYTVPTGTDAKPVRDGAEKRGGGVQRPDGDQQHPGHGGAGSGDGDGERERAGADLQRGAGRGLGAGGGCVRGEAGGRRRGCAVGGGGERQDGDPDAGRGGGLRPDGDAELHGADRDGRQAGAGWGGERGGGVQRPGGDQQHPGHGGAGSGDGDGERERAGADLQRGAGRGLGAGGGCVRGEAGGRRRGCAVGGGGERQDGDPDAGRGGGSRPDGDAELHGADRDGRQAGAGWGGERGGGVQRPGGDQQHPGHGGAGSGDGDGERERAGADLQRGAGRGLGAGGGCVRGEAGGRCRGCAVGGGGERQDGDPDAGRGGGSRPDGDAELHGADRGRTPSRCGMGRRTRRRRSATGR